MIGHKFGQETPGKTGRDASPSQLLPHLCWKVSLSMNKAQRESSGWYSQVLRHILTDNSKNPHNRSIRDQEKYGTHRLHNSKCEALEEWCVLCCGEDIHMGHPQTSNDMEPPKFRKMFNGSLKDGSIQMWTRLRQMLEPDDSSTVTKVSWITRSRHRRYSGQRRQVRRAYRWADETVR